MLSMFHEPSRAYIDPWTGQLFGEGGVEGSVAAAKEQAGKHFRFNSSKSPSEIKNAKGSVIMPKLGNETVKCVGPCKLACAIRRCSIVTVLLTSHM